MLTLSGGRTNRTDGLLIKSQGTHCSRPLQEVMKTGTKTRTSDATLRRKVYGKVLNTVGLRMFRNGLVHHITKGRGIDGCS